jgi:hypothetical protein
VSLFPLTIFNQFTALLAVSDFILADKLKSNPRVMIAFQTKITQRGQGNRRLFLNYTALTVNPTRFSVPFNKIDAFHQSFIFLGIDSQYPTFFAGILTLHHLHKIALA